MAAAARPARDEDADLVSSLNAEVQALHAGALPFYFKPPSAETFPPEYVQKLLAHSENIVLIAEIGEIGVGYAYAEISRRPETPWQYAFEMAYLHHIAVRSDFRGRGAGSALINAMRSLAQERGASMLAANVWIFNETARAFFRRHGFETYNEGLRLELRSPDLPHGQ